MGWATYYIWLISMDNVRIIFSKSLDRVRNSL